MSCQDKKLSFFPKNLQFPKKQVSNGFYQLSVRTGCYNGLFISFSGQSIQIEIGT